MEIKTKYDIGDELYTLHKNKIAKVKIKAVSCALSNVERYIGYEKTYLNLIRYLQKKNYSKLKKNY